MCPLSQKFRISNLISSRFRADTRKAGRIETMPDELFEDVKQAVNAYEREGDET